MLRSRSSWHLAVVALLVLGAVLTMHGVGVGAGAGPEAVPVSGHHGPPGHPHDDGGDCPECGPGHLLATCLAVVALAAGLLVVRARPTSVSPTSSPSIARRRVGRPRTLRPPGWRELSVMRC